MTQKLGRGWKVWLGPQIEIWGGKPAWEVPFQPSPSPQHTPVQYLLPEAKAQDSDKICVVIDLDETLVHSSFKVGLAQHLSAYSLLRGGRLPWPGREVSAVSPPLGFPPLQLQQVLFPYSQ